MKKCLLKHAPIAPNFASQGTAKHSCEPPGGRQNLIIGYIRIDGQADGLGDWTMRFKQLSSFQQGG